MDVTRDEVDSLRAVMAEAATEHEALRHELAEAEKRLGELRGAGNGGQGVAEYVQQQQAVVVELRREIQRRKIMWSDLASRIASAEVAAQEDQRGVMRQRNEALREDLDLLRREVLKGLLGIAELLRRQQRSAEEKLAVSAELAKLTGDDFGYENYISCALLHQKDYSGDVQFVVEAIKKARPVA